MAHCFKQVYSLGNLGFYYKAYEKCFMFIEITVFIEINIGEIIFVYTDPAENISIGGVRSPDLTSSLEVKSIVWPAPSWFFSPLSTNLSGAM